MKFFKKKIQEIKMEKKNVFVLEDEWEIIKGFSKKFNTSTFEVNSIEGMEKLIIFFGGLILNCKLE